RTRPASPAGASGSRPPSGKRRNRPPVPRARAGPTSHPGVGPAPFSVAIHAAGAYLDPPGGSLRPPHADRRNRSMATLKAEIEGAPQRVPAPARNPGTPLELDRVLEQRVNRSAAERRAATIGTRRAVKKEWQAAWLL